MQRRGRRHGRRWEAPDRRRECGDGGRVIKGPYARWAELVAEVAAHYAMHGHEAWYWVRDLFNQPDFEVLFAIIRQKGGVDAQLFEAYIIHKYPLVPRYSTLT